ncbi:MAG TPA: DUF2975 domain-containing protein [Flavisolibacter sp.]|jgi:hypothetical protein
MRTTTDKILAIMNVLTWVAFIGIMIKAGAILISYIVSVGNPEGAKDLYMGLDMYSLRQFDFWQYTQSVSFMVALLILQAYIAHMVIKVLSRIKMMNPFKIEVSKMLERISHFILGTWVVAILYNAHTKWLAKRIDGLQENLVSTEFIFLAGVVFVISQVFKKGVEIQSENELTV